MSGIVSAHRSPDRVRGTSRHEVLSALLVGLIGVIAAVLVFLEVSASHAGARAQATAARLASEATTRLNVSTLPEDFRLGKALEASQLALQATSRQMDAIEAGDDASMAIGAADFRASERLSALAEEMGADPDSSGPLDPYARTLLAASIDDAAAVVVEQNRQRDLADLAGARSTDAVLGLSLAALAGVIVGLAAVVGQGRSGAPLLALAYVLAAGAVIMAAAAAGLLTFPG